MEIYDRMYVYVITSYEKGQGTSGNKDKASVGVFCVCA